jgi:hypothetical protein
MLSYRKKAVQLRHTGAKEEREYRSYSFLTSALDGVSDQHHAQAALHAPERAHDSHWIGG